MGRRRAKNSGSQLGVALKKSFAKPPQHQSPWEGLHTVDGDARSGRLRSVLEMNDLNEFVESAVAENRDFAAQRPTYFAADKSATLSVLEAGQVEARDRDNERQRAEDDARPLLRIPRRPQWSREMPVHALEQSERDAFLTWRRAIAKLEESDKVLLTPFEKNIEVWRQLWRVVERSDLVVQIVDARNPLLFYSVDLFTYAKELSEAKRCLLVVNKADFLPEDFRAAWSTYFSSMGVAVVFFSAAAEFATAVAEGTLADPVVANGTDALDGLPAGERGTLWRDLARADAAPRLITRNELVDVLESCRCDMGVDTITVGMIGYPNVGKSTTINSLFGKKRVAASATPGKTKHFKTLSLSERVVLCDCPGLVLPNFAATKADMVCCGVLPIDQLRDYRPAVQLVCNRVSRVRLNEIYGIQIPMPADHEPADRPALASELLQTLATALGYMRATHGGPDESRTARVVLKDYFNGKVLWCEPPPTVVAAPAAASSSVAAAASSSSA